MLFSVYFGMLYEFTEYTQVLDEELNQKLFVSLISRQHVLAQFACLHCRPSCKNLLHKPIDKPTFSWKTNITSEEILEEKLECIRNAWCIHRHRCVVELYPVAAVAGWTAYHVAASQPHSPCYHDPSPAQHTYRIWHRQCDYELSICNW